MSQERTPPPAPLHLVGEVVGPDGEDVSGLTTRAIMVRAYDVSLRTNARVQTLESGLHLELGHMKSRIGALETGHRPPAPPPRPPANDDDDAEDSQPSIHEWNEILAEAGHALSKQVKADNKFDSNRARAIAEDAAKHVLHRAKEEAELSTWRKIKGIVGKLAWETAKYGIPAAIVGAAIWVWHTMQMAAVLAHK